MTSTVQARGARSKATAVLTAFAILAAVLGVTLPSAAAATTKVMPLGDSLTHGSSVPGGYRINLEAHLRAGNHAFDFVGSQANGPTELTDQDHEGHRGWTIAEVDAAVDGWLATERPHVVTLMIGTNDMTQRLDAGAPDRLRTLVERIARSSSSPRVLVSSIPPLAANWDTTRPARAKAYNVAVEQVVSDLAAAGLKVTFVDGNAVLTEADLVDGIHLSRAGYDKLAAVWYQAMRPFLPAPGTTTTTAPPTTVTTQPTTTSTTTAPSTGGPEILVSAYSNRPYAKPLDGVTTSLAKLYIFTWGDDLRQVEFWLDDPQGSGAPMTTDTTYPYDLVGGNRWNALPLDASSMVNGTHTVRARATSTSGVVTTSLATFTVTGGITSSTTTTTTTAPTTTTTAPTTTTTAPTTTTTAPTTTTTAPTTTTTAPTTTTTAPTTTTTAPTTTTTTTTAPVPTTTTTVPAPVGDGPEILASAYSNRPHAVPLDGATTSRSTLYVFTWGDGLRQVEFWLDDPQGSGAPMTTDTSYPYDLVGGNRWNALPLDVSALAPGTHTVRARATSTAGAVTTSLATFTVTR